MAPRKKSIQLSTQELIDVYQWIKKFKLSKEIKNINRDLSDGVLVAEILKHLYPKIVDLHNYTRCNAVRNKLDNWQTLNRKVFHRLNIYLDDEMITDLASGTNGMLEVLLYEMMAKYTLENNLLHEVDESKKDMFYLR
ncbi:sperm flagellar protein 1-like [Anopheles funestus]|uniref:Calponin-homology (CH) domain-containing protein n=1 Tax=Anopheles funestus TaxID=62324 RepID=A0A182RDT1_ANOFN|nr:sperm flagellar protein 1-like [Anopheles funestus]